MLTLIEIKQDLQLAEKTKIARIIVALVSLLGVRREVYMMLK